MKQLMIAMAVAAFGIAANAASVDWSSGDLVDHNGDVLNKSTLYTAQIYFFTDEAGTQSADALFSNNGEVALTSTKSSKNGNYLNSTYDQKIPGGTYWAKLVITGNAGTAAEGWSLTSDIASFVYDDQASSGKAIEFLSGSGFTSETAKLNNSGTNYGWQSVPEPTSGLLLLLGVAGLALRRRRA